MSTKSARTKQLATATKAALNVALSARRRLAAAMTADGDVHVPMFLTADEHREIVRKMRTDHRNEMRSMLSHFMLGPSAELQAMAKLAVAGKRGGGLSQAERNWLDRIASSFESERGLDSARRQTASAIVRAGNKRRAEED